MKVKRDVGLDLLRVVSMLMIVMLHYLGKGGALETAYGSKVNCISWAIEAFCIVAVNCYVFITGYFLVNSTFKINKVVKLWGQVLFYSITIYLVLLFSNAINFNLNEAIRSFMPIMTREYWFITVYILLYILSPYLNILIHNLSKLQFKIIISLLLFVFCICITFMPEIYTLDMTRGYGIIWLICLYFIGAYIRLYKDEKSKNNIINLLGYILITALVISSRFVITDICNRFSLNLLYNVRLYQYNSITIFLSSLFLFLFCKNLSINSNILKNCILNIAPFTFGVYLIHEQLGMRVILYRDILHTTNYLVSAKYFMVYAIISVIYVFAVCIVIEYIRHNMAVYIGKTKVYNILENYVVNKYKIIRNKFDD